MTVVVSHLMIAATACVLVLGLPAASALADVSSTTPTAASGECSDGIDNDGDGLVDTTLNEFGEFVGDPGCHDDTPWTEKLTQPASLTATNARIRAYDALEQEYPGPFDRVLSTKFEHCTRRSTVAFFCITAFTFHNYVYFQRQRVYHYVDQSDDTTWWGYQMRKRRFFVKGAGDALSMKCNQWRCRLRIPV